MKRTLVLLAGLLALVALPVMAQAPAGVATGKVHGQVLNPTGQPQSTGTVSLSTDGTSSKLDMPVGAEGVFSGEFAVGTYYLIYRNVDTPKDQMVDSVKGVKIVAGVDLLQNIDMSRQEFIDKMAPEQRKQLEELKKTNAAALQANSVIAHLNTDLKTVNTDKHEIDIAAQTAAQQLGAGATKADIDAKTLEIKTAKYTDIESLMTTDTNAKGDEALLWNNLAYAQFGLKKNDEAIATYKKALELESASKKPRGEVIGQSQAGIGEVYARTGKTDEAQAAYDEAAKADPVRGGTYLKNEAIIYYQLGNAAAQGTAADKAIALTPNDAILYYLKGNALVGNATIDPKTSQMVLPPDCIAAYQKYLELAPTGPFAADVNSILASAGQKVTTTYKAPTKK